MSCWQPGLKPSPSCRVSMTSKTPQEGIATQVNELLSETNVLVLNTCCPLGLFIVWSCGAHCCWVTNLKRVASTCHLESNNPKSQSLLHRGGRPFYMYLQMDMSDKQCYSSLVFLSVSLGSAETRTASSQPWGKILTLLCRKLWDSIHLYIRITFSKDSVPRPHRSENTQWQLELQVTINSTLCARLLLCRSQVTWS